MYIPAATSARTMAMILLLSFIVDFQAPFIGARHHYEGDPKIASLASIFALKSVSLSGRIKVVT